MNFFKGVFVVALALVSAQSYAVGLDTKAQLPQCGGNLTAVKTAYGDLKISVKGVMNCSNVEISMFGSRDRTEKLDGRNNRRYGEFVVSSYDLKDITLVTVVVQSNSGVHKDTVQISIPAPAPRAIEMTVGERAHLSSCGGTVEITNKGEQLNLVFRNVQNCSNFDILSNSGTRFAYKAKKLEKRRHGEYGGSFTIPKRMVKNIFESFLGYNAVTVRVNSNSGIHSDTIILKFFNW